MKKVIRISESELKKIIKKVISESHKDVTCENCGWSWDIEPDDKHPYLCHQCGHQNKKVESKEGAGAYDAPPFPMEPDHVHFKKIRNRF
jgi:Zn finger protein HypA/HybF involved in hydrogenase expression